jgi:hypothetical protein
MYSYQLLLAARHAIESVEAGDTVEMETPLLEAFPEGIWREFFDLAHRIFCRVYRAYALGVAMVGHPYLDVRAMRRRVSTQG